MKDVIAAFGSEIFRPLVTILMPGFIAIAPYFIWLRLRFSGFDRIVQNNGTETALVLIGLAVLLGLILDGFGSHIETGWDGCYPPQHVADWFLYLRHAFDVDPIGKGYIKFLVLKLKFELGLYCGILVAMPAAFFLTLRYLEPGTFISCSCSRECLLFGCGMKRVARIRHSAARDTN